MDSNDYICLILYYGRKGYYYSMQKTALDGLAKNPNLTCFRLFNGIALALGNRVQEGIRELNPLKNESEFSLGALLALIYAHKRCTVLDHNAISQLEERLKNEQKTSNASATYYAALLLYLIGDMEKAIEFNDRSLKYDAHYEPSIVLKAWIDFTFTFAFNANTLNTLEKLLSHGKNIDASLAVVRYFQLRGQFDNAINTLNQLSVRFPELNVPLIEKMETQLAAFDWDHAYDTSLRIINLEATNISALQIKALYLLSREYNVKNTIATLQKLLAAIERVEMGNYAIVLSACQLFAGISSRNREIISLTSRYLEKISKLNPSGVEFTTELGFQKLMLCNYSEAASHFRSATKKNDNYFYALCGLTICQLSENGNTEQTQQQLEYLQEICGVEKNSLLLFLRGCVAENSNTAISFLVEATENHLKTLERHIFGAEYLRLLNPDFMIRVATQLLRHSPTQMSVNLGTTTTLTIDTQHVTLKHCAKILELIIRSCPKHPQAIYMRAKIEFLCGEVTVAAQTLQHILNDIDISNTDAHLLLVQIQMKQKKYTNAMHTLEMALSHDFAVRENPMYHMLLGLLQKQQQQLVEAKKSFLTALQMVGCSYLNNDQHLKTPRNEVAAIGFPMADKVTLYLELIITLREIGDTQGIYEGERLLQCAMEEFSNTPEEGRVLIAHADLMLQNCNVAKAINLLTSIQPNQSYYIQAKTHLANIYLKQQNDRVSFANCFKELVTACPEAESFLKLGEAYMSIQEPDLAIDAFKKALDLNPNDSLLASKLGRAYVKTHQYNKAIKYYKEALENPDHSTLKLDLAELYLKLKQYKNGADLLAYNMDESKIDSKDILTLQVHTKELLLLSRIHEKSGDNVLSLQTLKEARHNQYRIQKRLSIEPFSNLDEQYKILSKICFLMSKLCINLRDNEQALVYFQECLKYTPHDIEILSSLARLYMQMNMMENCRDVCLQILQIDSSNEAASVMMADLSFRKTDFENAAYHFSQLLISQPCYWTALTRFIEVMRRSGTLSEVNSFLQRAEQSITHPSHALGLSYCKGLYEWYSGNPNGALRNFNMARKDPEWGQQAVFNMIEICINPDGDIPNSNDIQDGDVNDDFTDSRVIALRTAERLLKELRPKPGGMDNEALNYRLLQNFLLCASKQKFQIESALQDFTDLASRTEYQNMVGPVFGMASALVQLKQTQRAKNHLKRIARQPWNFEEAEFLERSWLLLADIYIHGNKLDVADGFVERTLEHNKSSLKAFELAGYIAEKSQLYREAANHYNNAWNYGGRSKPHIGYKLAFNYMKAKRYADAIDVCQQVLKLHPDYMIIRKDILDKCRPSLRP